jgi:N-sulfoglucosamine sulfohydrolase
MYRAWPNAASLLKNAGYRTGIIGKLHINPEAAFPFDFRWGPKEFCSFEHRNVRKIAEVARQFVDQSADPFFLMVNYPDTHLPYLNQDDGLPKKLLTPDEASVFPFVGLDTPQLRTDVAGYYNCLSRLDTGVGLLLDALEAAGRASSTLVIYLGDHGCQFPRGKLTCYEPGVRIPLVVRWPGAPAQSAGRRELVSTVDLMPTILEAAGVSAPDRLPGRSLAALARGERVAWREYLCTEYHSHIPPLYFPQRSVRDDRYKLILSLLHDRPNPVAPVYFSPKTWWAAASEEDVAAATKVTRAAVATWSEAKLELYDLRNDPYELRNGADERDMAATRKKLLDKLREWREETHDPLLDRDLLARLTAEQDAAAASYPKYEPDFAWKYAEYLDRQPLKK